MGYPDTFEGFRVQSFDKWSEWEKQEFKPKKFEDRDIDIEIVACGLCGSDIHTATGGWGDAPLPLAVGHEVVGRAVKVGPGVTTVKVGDRVGVGAQIGSCLECKLCKSDNENYCPKMVDTYGAPFPVDGTIAQGGFSSHIRAHEYFTFKIPDSIPTEAAAPMMCAGLTTYGPLERAGTGPGKKVAIVGIGGLGHFGVMWAAALGAEVTAISHTPDKKEDALKLGAKHFVCSKDKDWAEPLKYTFDFVLNCADMTQEFDLTEYFSILNIGAKFHNVGLPDAPLPELKAQDFVSNNAYMGASHIGSRPEMFRMLELAAKQNLKPFIQTIPISVAGCKEAAEKLKVNDVRYRFTLTDFDKAFGTKGFN